MSDLYEKAYCVMDIEEMMEEKIKEFRIPNTGQTNCDPSRQFLPKDNQRDKFLELQNILPPARPMNEASSQYRNNGKYCESVSITKIKVTTKECKTLARVLIDIEKTNTPQVNLVNNEGPTKTIFVIMGNTQTKRNLEVFTVTQSFKKTKTNYDSISFSDHDLNGIEVSHQDPLVITANINTIW